MYSWPLTKLLVMIDRSKNRYVDVYTFRGKMLIVSCMGHSMYVKNPEANIYLIAKDSSCDDIGKNVRRALAEYMYLDLARAKELLNPAVSGRLFDEWFEGVREPLNIQQETEFWNEVEYCRITKVGDQLKVCAHKISKQGRIQFAGEIELDADVDSSSLGEALLNGFKLCEA